MYEVLVILNGMKSWNNLKKELGKNIERNYIIESQG